LIRDLNQENNIIERISLKEEDSSENILDKIFLKNEIEEFTNSLVYILEKSHKANYETITPRTARRESDHMNIKEENYNKDMELICITDEGKETREEVKILYSVSDIIKNINI